MARWTKRRQAARAVVFDPQGRVLLISAHDPANRTDGHWWELPGGGIDPGEETHHAVQRELWEEAGIQGAVIGPVVFTQTVQFTFAGWHFDQDEWIHVAHFDGEASGPKGLEAFETMAFGEQRWWEVDEIVQSGERTIPYRLSEFLPALFGAAAPHDPIDITPNAAHVQAWRAPD